MKKKFIYLFLLIAAVMCRCTKPYTPVEVTTDYGYLVVEGNINPGTDSTIIKLSRTVKILALTPKPELKAVVTVENEQNISYSIKEISNGYYAAVGLNLDKTKKYRLRIKTAAGKTYLSDFVPVKNTPVIDSIGFKLNSTNSGMTIYANAHDATGNSRYYRWEYQETWQFNVDYNSKWMPDPKLIGVPLAHMIPRTVALYTCWANNSSSTIVLGSSAKLSQDVIYQNPIIQIESTSEKVSIKYSILVKQYALTEDAYNFWTLMKKNTEQLGSIFDAQPSAVQSNIHNIADATEPVVGYVSIGTVQIKRIFISKSDLPASFHMLPSSCGLDTALYYNAFTHHNDVKDLLYQIPQFDLAIDSVADVNLNIYGYSYSSRDCSDCTLRGVTKKPAFWQ